MQPKVFNYNGGESVFSDDVITVNSSSDSGEINLNFPGDQPTLHQGTGHEVLLIDVPNCLIFTYPILGKGVCKSIYLKSLYNIIAP